MPTSVKIVKPQPYSTIAPGGFEVAGSLFTTAANVQVTVAIYRSDNTLVVQHPVVCNLGGDQTGSWFYNFTSAEVPDGASYIAMANATAAGNVLACHSCNFTIPGAFLV
jgi:hypothetical protein